MKAMLLEWHSDISAIANEWDALAERTGAQPWTHPGWVASWSRAFGDGPPEIAALRVDGELRAVLPMQRKLGALVSVTNWHTPEFDAVGDRESIATLLREILRTRPRRMSFGFVNVSAAGPLELRTAAAGRGYRLIVRSLERSPYIRIDRPWEEYVQERDSKMLRDLRRRRRKLEAEEHMSLTISCGEERLDELLDEGFRVEAMGWKGEQGMAIASRPETRQFYREIAHWAAPRGWLRLAHLSVGSTAIAFDFSIEHAGVHYLLKTGFDPSAGRYAPGKLLRLAMIERAFQIGLSSYEFLGADEPWKLEWTDTVRERSLVQVFAPSLPGKADFAAFAYVRPLVKRVLAFRGE